VADEDADYQKAVEESMKVAYALPKGLLPPVVIREPESGKYQPLLEVPGKGKAKVTEEQFVFLDLVYANFVFVFVILCLYTMADVNAPSGQAPAMAPPVRTDDQILPRIRCQLDEQWFVLTKDTLREALQITPVNNNQAFVTPPSSDALINFVNELGYPKFHPRPDSLLHLPNEEPVLGYLKFSAKGTKREVFGMPIPGSLITADIQEASYYLEYLANVAKHRRYLAGETGSDQDSPAPKPTKPARKPKSTAPKAPPRPSVSTPVTSAQPAPTSAPAIPQEKKRKQATETSNKPPKAKKSKYGFIGKKHSLKSVAEDVLSMEPRVATEDTDLQKALEESMKTMYAAPKGPLPPVVIREPASGKYQPLPEVPGKGKAKVAEEQVAHDLLSLQKPKKKSHADQYIFQRRTSTPTGSSRHDEPSYAELEQSEHEESKKVVPGADEGGQGKGKGQAGPDPGAQAEGQTGSDADPGNAEAEVKSIPSPVVHAGSDREQMDLDAADVPPQPSTEQLDEGFTAIAYPKVQENLKLTVEEHVLLEDHASSSRTLSSLQQLSKDISFGDLFFNDKHSEANNDKTTVETEVESMVSVTIQQDMSSIPSMMSPIINLTLTPESSKVHQQFKATTIETTTTTTLPPPPAQQQSTTEAMMMKRIGKLEHIMDNLIQVNKDMEESEVITDAVDWAMQAPLRNHFRDLPKADMKEILHQRMWETESYKSYEDHMQMFEALEKSMNRDHSKELAQGLAEARKKKKKSRESTKTPPGSPPHQPLPPPPPAGPSGALGAHGASGSSQVPPPPPLPSSTNQKSPSKGSAAPSSSKTAASAEYQAWTTTDIRLRPQDWWKLLEEEHPATPEPAWSISSSDVPVPTNNWASTLASNYSPPLEDSLLAQPVTLSHLWTGSARDELLTDSVDEPILRHNISKPLPPPPGQVTIQYDFFFNKDLEYLRYGSKDDEDIESSHIPKVNLRQDWWKLFEEERPATLELAWSIRSSDVPTGDIATFMDWFCKIQECHKLLTDSVDNPILRHNVSKPLPLGGPPGQVTIQSDFFFNKDLEYLRYGSKGSRPALSILKMKAVYYPDFGLEQMVPDQFWIEKECKYDIAAIAVRTHMRILSVVRIIGFSMYGYDYMKRIVLHHADLNEHVIAERDFKYLYPSDFEDLYLLYLQGHLNHLSPKDKKILTTATQLNLAKPQWDAMGFEYKHDYTVIDFSRVVMFRDKYRVHVMMRFTKIHKFNDGTLQQIDVALDYRVKEFRINRMNPEPIEDKEDLSQPGELCWWMRQRGRLQTFEAYRMIKSLRHSRPLSDDL
nr:hypothetical protein [Tanacetum cinerariifolium]